MCATENNEMKCSIYLDTIWVWNIQLETLKTIFFINQESPQQWTIIEVAEAELNESRRITGFYLFKFMLGPS